MTLDVKEQGTEQVIVYLGKFRDRKLLRKQMTIAMSKFLLALKKYPQQVRGLHIQFVSDRQRRGFFARLRAGEIAVPYRRTRTLGRRWTSKVEDIVGGVMGVAGNVTPYAPVVQDRDRQAAMHQGNWPTAQDTLEGMTPTLVATLKEAYDD